MTLTELRAIHAKSHTGYIWQCPHCAAEYWRLKAEEQNEQTTMLMWL